MKYFGLVICVTALLSTGLLAEDIYEVNGRFGIGTTQPQEKLHVVGNIKLNENTSIIGTNGVKLQNGHGGYVTQDQHGHFHVRRQGNSASSLRLYGSGNLVDLNFSGSRFSIQNGADLPIPRLSLVAQDIELEGGVRIGDRENWYSNYVLSLGTQSNNARIGIQSKNAQYGASLDLYKSSTLQSQIEIESGNNDFIIRNRANGNLVFKTNNAEKMRIAPSGQVLVGTTSEETGFKMVVAGSVKADDFISRTNAWADYVFESGYDLMSLKELGLYVNANKHLPHIPAEAEVLSGGVNLTDMQVRLLRTIEEYALHLVDMDRRLSELEAENMELRRLLGQ